MHFAHLLFKALEQYLDEVPTVYPPPGVHAQPGFGVVTVIRSSLFARENIGMLVGIFVCTMPQELRHGQRDLEFKPAPTLTWDVALRAAGAVLINDTVDPSLIAHVTVRQNPADDNSAEVSVWDHSVRHAHPYFATTKDGDVVPFRQPRTPSDRDIERFREYAPSRTW